MISASLYLMVVYMASVYSSRIVCYKLHISP